MASSGSFLSSGWYSSSKGDNVYLEFAWSVTNTSIAENYKDIYWELRGKRTASGYTMAGGFQVIIDGETVYNKSTDYRIELRNGTVVASGTKRLWHHTDGTRSFPVHIQGGINTYAVNVSGDTTFYLDTIPRASSISCTTVHIESNPTITISRASPSFTHKIEYQLGGLKDTIEDNTSATTITDWAWPASFYAQIPNAREGYGTLTCTTYNGGTPIGTSTCPFTVITDESKCRPTVQMSLSPVHSLPEAFNGIYIQGLTQVKAVLSATPTGTSIKYYDFTVDGKTYGSGNNYTSGYLANPGEISVVGRAVDGREYPGYANGSVTVIPYAHPKIQNTTAKRCDENGNLTTSGEYLKITAKRSYQPVLSGGVQKNFCSIRYRYKTEEASYYSDWETILDGHDLSSDEIVTGSLLDGGLLATKS